MAEADPVQQLDSTETSIYAGLTECPICLSQFQCPKSLPCLHTFCKECLQTFIIKYATDMEVVPVSFPCPICRRDTQPVDASVCRDRWAEQYPNNNLILAILDMKDLQLSNKLCNPCQKKRKLEKDATLWCRNCNVFMCDNCKEDHDVFIDGHTVLTSQEIETDPTKTITVSAKCKIHEETMKLFCQDHEVVCCSTCVAVGHRKCDHVVTVKEQAKNLRENKETGSLLTGICKDISTLDRLLDDSKANLDNLSDDKKKKKSEMEQLRKRIDAHLDDLQKIDTMKLEEAVGTHENDIKSRMKSINNLKKVVEQSQKQVRAAEICMDDAELVMTVQKVSAAREASQRMVEENVALKKRYTIGVQVNKAVQGIFDISTLIEVDNVCMMAGGPFQWCNKAKITHTIQMAPNSRTTGVLYLGADTIVTVDYCNSMLNCHLTAGNLKFNLTLEAQPWDICRMDGNGIAVTIPEKKQIVLVEVMENNFSLTGNIQVDRKCYGIACVENTFLVTCTRDQKILFLSTSGKIRRTINGNKSMWHASAPKGSKNFIISERHRNKGETMLHTLGEKETMVRFFSKRICFWREGNGR